MSIKFLFVSALIALTLSLNAQTYSFSVSNGTYTDLVGSTSLNNGMTWDDPNFAIPIGFNFQLFDSTITTLYFSDWGLGGELSPNMSYSSMDKLLIPFGSDVIDRGYNLIVGNPTANSLSNLSYLVDGTPGSQILKMEWNNVGFYSDLDDDNTSTDFVNFQLWLYEGFNDIEIHFGPSLVAQPLLSYDGEFGTHVGLYPSVDLYAEVALADGYLLRGDPTAPIAYYEDTLYNMFLDGTIPDGTIYKFSSILSSNSTIEHSLSGFQIFPNPCNKSFNLVLNDKNDTIEKASILDTSGKVIKEIDTNTDNIDVSDLSSGFYIVQIMTESGSIAINKLVKK